MSIFVILPNCWGATRSDMVEIFEITRFVAHELMLFSIIGFLIGGLDDLAIDLIWIVRTSIRGLTVYRHQPRSDSATLALPVSPGRAIVFIPAWDEGNVIGQMLAHSVAAYGEQDYRIYVGCYPNDAPTQIAVESVGSSHVRMVVGTVDGPTTKADCLNTLWRALATDEQAEGWRAKSIILHDAEDLVHSGELRVFDTLIERFDFVQLPVLPLVDAGSAGIISMNSPKPMARPLSSARPLARASRRRGSAAPLRVT